MAEESSNECMPLDLSIKAAATQRTSHDGTQGASSTLGAYRTISDDALRYPGNTQHTPTIDETCNVDGVLEYGSTSYQRLGFTGNIDHARPRTSRAGMEAASASFQDGAIIPETTSVHRWNTQYYPADGASTVSGHTHKTETGSAGFALPAYSSSSGGVDNAVAGTNYASAEEPSDIFGNDAWNSTGTAGREQQELSGACSNVSSGQDALHGHANEHMADTADTCKPCHVTSTNNSKFVKHCRKSRGENEKCETCGKLFREAVLPSPVDSLRDLELALDLELVRERERRLPPPLLPPDGVFERERLRRPFPPPLLLRRRSGVCDRPRCLEALRRGPPAGPLLSRFLLPASSSSARRRSQRRRRTT
ncbi:uncharacterized protein [Dermacentor albipictus]|uniref:uncharacterized protein n=1 Tax=Dermacentor albipictus TaxID=60249 RepID=UPI0038FC1A47